MRKIFNYINLIHFFRNPKAKMVFMISNIRIIKSCKIDCFIHQISQSFPENPIPDIKRQELEIDEIFIYLVTRHVPTI